MTNKIKTLFDYLSNVSLLTEIISLVDSTPSRALKIRYEPYEVEL